MELASMAFELLTINRKSHTPFFWRQNQRTWMTLNGRYVFYCRKDASLGAHHEHLNLSPAKSLTLLSADVRFMRIFAGFPLRRAVKRQWNCGERQFSAFLLAISQDETLEMRPALLYRDTQSVVGFSVIRKCMILNDPGWLFPLKFCFRAGLPGFRRFATVRLPKMTP